MEDFESSALPHLNDLFRTALRILGVRAEAEDLVQEAYLQAWKSFHHFEPGTNCRAWLFKILFRMIQRHRRKWFSGQWAAEDTVPLQESSIYEPPISEHLRDEEVLSALRKVPGDYRDVVLLADVQEFSYKEIATMLKIPGCWP